MGAVAKLCNNLMQFVAWVGLTEAARLGDEAGLEREKLVEVLSWILNDNAKLFLQTRSVLEGDPENAFLKERFTAAMGLADKDLSLALEVGRQLGVSLPATALTRESVARLFGIADPKKR